MTSLSLDETTGGNCKRSPNKINWTPPKGSLLPLFIFKDKSIASNISALNIELSSISNISSLLIKSLSFKILTSFFDTNLGGNLKKE